MKNYLVVGASKGIGAEVSALLSKSGKVITISRTAIAEAGDHYYCDVLNGSLPEIENPLDGLVYCPGSINLRPFTSLSEKDFVSDFEINFLGAVRTIKAYLGNLKASKQASVVLFSTVAVNQGMPFHASVASAKGAVEGLVRSLAAEYAPQIRFNAIAPSLTDTPMAARLLRSEKQREMSAERHPMKRIGHVNDIAMAVEFLISEKSSWTTGQIFHIDGGISSLKI